MEPEERVPRPGKMNFARASGLALGSLLGGMFLACGPLACSGTEVPDPDDAALLGQVQGVDGQPAASARVIAWGDPAARQAADENPGTVYRDTQYTDGQGRFSFGKQLAAGTYELYFEDTSSVDSVKNRPVQRLANT